MRSNYSVRMRLDFWKAFLEDELKHHNTWAGDSSLKYCRQAILRISAGFDKQYRELVQGSISNIAKVAQEWESNRLFGWLKDKQPGASHRPLRLEGGLVHHGG